MAKFVSSSITYPKGKITNGEFNPFNPLDALGDLDHDGLSNLFESKHGLNIQDPDTDHDGIDDGYELNYWNVSMGLDMDTSVEYCKIPDVDGDNITDGKEIKGYKVKIITGWKGDGTPISEMRYISPAELDPLVPYANSTGVWTDTDKDGIPDVAETYLSNRSQWSYFAKHYSALWNNYSWISDYFKTVKSNQNESAAKQWLQDQFNSLIVERTPPVITKFLLWWDDEGFDVYAVVDLVVHDVGGIKELNIWDENNGEWAGITDGGETTYRIYHKFSSSGWEQNFGSVRVKVEAKDYAGNSITVENELKSSLKKLWDALTSLWNAIWNALQKVAQAIMSALSFIVEWIKA